MTISPNTQAILLLTVRLSRTSSEKAKPLTPREWGRFAEWMKAHSLAPDRLLNGKLTAVLNDWHDSKIPQERIEVLLNRGSALALSMEKWLRSGLWVITRSDPNYPRRLKQRLRADSPAVLFGCGEMTLLNKDGLAVVGSRNAKEDDLKYSRELGALAAADGYSVVSGGARGVDDAALRGALAAEGTAAAVLADSLLRASSSAKYRRHLLEKNLVLLSPFNPESGFNAGNAMQRNKYIYCLADAALAVHSGKKGGTWNGVRENLKHRWVPMWVKQTDDPEAGNSALIREGAAPAPSSTNEVRVKDLIGQGKTPIRTEDDLFSQNVEALKEGNASYAGDTGAETSEAMGTNSDELHSEAARSAFSGLDFYTLFLGKVREACSEEPRQTDELAELLEIHKTQLNIWLKRAVAEEKLKKLTKPVRYQWIGGKQATLDFDMR
jgi:predicted Rossmann fold nucleotide-binding protein DprA/Smf involved in DNA uptake